MTELLTAAQMRSIEQAAIDSGTVTGLELMERAGVGVVKAIYEEWPAFAEVEAMRGARPSSSIGRSEQWRNNERPPEYLEQDEKPLRAVVLCGPGNNGGDGFVVARLLHDRGWAVEAFLYGDAAKLPPDARVNYERWCKAGEALPFDRRTYRSLEGKPLIVDAVFGIGITRFVPQSVSDVFDQRWDCLRVAVDTPSGLCSDSGCNFGFCPANLTVTFHRAKLGHYLGSGARDPGGYWGGSKLKVVDIGLDQPHSHHTQSIGWTLYAPEHAALANLAHSIVHLTMASGNVKKNIGHKFSHGHALIVSGGPGHTGAARLAARGALRIGAGIVTLGVPPAAQQEAASQLTAIMLKRVGDAVAFEKVLEDQRITALCLGPALGLGEEKAALIRTALKSRRNCVLDADALTLLSQDETLFAQLHSGCVLTPHAGEFARLFPDISEKLAAPATKGPAYSKVDAARDASARAGCVVLFKGPDTVIAEPGGRAALNAAVYERAAPWLATAGSGDVLAGFITGLMARGFSPFDAAQSGAWLHVECALKFGPGLIAEDLPEQLPKVFRDLC